ncbi:hypothetical protein [Paraburkholderia diazotrophica]|uniref:hypothetical protein n=1 Tax=Paraburkholderia diazotrophica TaxID=667676 RepID=UPI00316CEC2A
MRLRGCCPQCGGDRFVEFNRSSTGYLNGFHATSCRRMCSRHRGNWGRCSTELKAEAESIRSELEAVRDDEQVAFDNMFASRQSGERWQNVEASIDNLDTAICALDEIEDLTDLVDGIEALGNAENG